MNAEFTLPQARIPIGWVTVKGERIPVQIDTEWMLTLSRLFERSGGVSGDASFTQYITQFFDPPPIDSASQEAIRAVDELRNELASSRSDVQSLKSLIEEQATALAQLRSADDLRSRMDELETTLAGTRVPFDFRDRIEQIENRLQ